MPFTFSHPAVVLPLAYLPKKWVSMTGLIIGSLLPDFEYFIRMKILSIHSHELIGLLWFDLPLGLLSCFVFHNIVRESLLNNLPLFFKERLLVFNKFDWNEYFINHWKVVLASILIGAYSHILWDSFTHENAYFVTHIPWLETKVFFLDKEIPIFKLVQHTSTLIGAFVIGLYFYNLPTFKVGKTSIDYKYWLIFFAVFTLTIFFRFLAGLSFLGDVVVSIISAGMIGTILTPLLQKILHYKA